MLIYFVEAYIIQRKTQNLVVDSKEMGLEVHADKTTYMAMSRDQTAGRNHNIKTDNKSSESVEQFKYSGTTLKN
jgi:hypothetical protein